MHNKLKEANTVTFQSYSDCLFGIEPLLMKTEEEQKFWIRFSFFEKILKKFNGFQNFKKGFANDLKNA